MEYQNITPSIPKKKLKKVKHIAVKKNASVPGLLSRHLEEIAKDDAYQKAKTNQMELIKKGFDLMCKNGASWARKDLHERRWGGSHK